MRPPIESHRESATRVCEHWGLKKPEIKECFIEISKQ